MVETENYLKILTYSPEKLLPYPMATRQRCWRHDDGPQTPDQSNGNEACVVMEQHLHHLTAPHARSDMQRCLAGLVRLEVAADLHWTESATSTQWPAARPIQSYDNHPHEPLHPTNPRPEATNPTTNRLPIRSHKSCQIQPTTNPITEICLNHSPDKNT